MTVSEDIGTVKAIYRYPVKSLAGEPLASANLRWTGIEGDRQYAYVRTENRSRFPWLTGRDIPELVTYQSRYVDPSDPRRSPVRVVLNGQDFPVDSNMVLDRLAEAAGEPVGILQLGRGAFDSMPVSVLSTATLEFLGAELGRRMDVRRFRPNIVIEPFEGRPQRETEWTSGVLIFGDSTDRGRLMVNTPIERCVMTTIDPETAKRDPAVLANVVRLFGNRVGAYCVTDTAGLIREGDRVRLCRR